MRDGERERRHKFAAVIGLGLWGYRWTGALPVVLDGGQRGQARVFLAAAPARHWDRARVRWVGLRLGARSVAGVGG
jgi:hypothetical protein